MSRYGELSERVRLTGRSDGFDEAGPDTTRDLSRKLAGVSRRDFFNIASRFGLTSTLAAASSMTGLFSASALAQTTNSTYEKRFAKKPKFVLKSGTVQSKDVTKIQRNGIWEFVQDLEERTNGEIRVELIGQAQICAEPTCIQKAMQGIIDIPVSATQNAASVAPWLNALDFPFMFQSRGQIYYFFFHPKSEPLFRKVYRERHGLEFLFSHAELRDMFMGTTWADKPPVDSVNALSGSKNRVTNTELGRIAMQLMSLNPVPVAWTETLDALKNGLIDGMETWASAAAAFNMAPVLTKQVGLNFIPGCEHTAIRVETLEKLGPELTDAVMESAYATQKTVMYGNEASLASLVGYLPEAPPSTIFGKNGIEMNFLSEAALAEAEDMANPRKPEYDRWHEKLNGWAGFDVYQEFKSVAREYPREKPAIFVEPRRWWRGEGA